MPRVALWVLPLLLLGCSQDYWWGDGPGATASVTTPAGIQTGDVVLTYTLTGSRTESDVKVEYSTDGYYFSEATQGRGSDGTNDLPVSETGELHTFVWASGTDLEGERLPSVYLQVTPTRGTPDITGPLRVHNLRYVLGTEKPAAAGSSGRVRLYSLDALSAAIRFKQSTSTGGLDPYDVAYDDGLFFVANEGSNNLSVYELDDFHGILYPIAGSPFPAGVARPRYLATDGLRLFVSGSGDSVGVLRIDQVTGKLDFVYSVWVQGCRSLVVRSGYLFIASETAGQIRIYDIEANGELLLNAYSPISTGGLDSPRALALLETRVYAGNVGASSLCGFNLLGGGNLVPLSSSPYSVSSAVTEHLVRNGAKLFGVTGTGGELVSVTVDDFGDLVEDASSPWALSGTSLSVISVGSVVVAPTTEDALLHLWKIDPLTGELVLSVQSPFSTSVALSRLAVSD